MNLRTSRFGIALTLVLATASLGFADNVTPATARSIAMNSTSQDSLQSGVRTSVWYKVEMFAGRSYQISVWSVKEDGVFVNIEPVELFSDAAGTVLVSAGVTSTDAALEGSPNDANLGPKTTIFQPTATGLYLIHAGTDTLALAATKVNIRVRETTLFSPWLSKAAGYEGFIELHNNTNAAVSVTLKAYDSAGTLQGAGLTFAIPANATMFQTGALIGVPAGVATGVVLTHNSAFGAISGNITTLNGATGLSFDSPFTPRDFAGGGGSDAGDAVTALGLSCADGQVLKWSSSAWTCGTDVAGTGTVTGVTASAPLSTSGGAAAPVISLTGIVAIANGGTGAIDATSARANLGLGPLATMSPTGVAGATTFLRGDSTWASTGTIGGAGTVNFLPAFSAATTLGNSVIQQAQPSGWSNTAVGFAGTPGTGTVTSPVGVDLQGTVSEGSPNGYSAYQLVVEGTLASSAFAQAYLRGIVVTPAFNFSAGYGNYAEGVYIAAPTITAGYANVVSSLELAPPAAGPAGTSCSAALNILMPNQSGPCPAGGNRVWSIYNGSTNNNFFAGNVGFGQALPTHPIETGGGAYVTTGGVWTNASSRELKKDIRPLSGDEATKTLAALLPVTFKYKADDEAHVGFIAEDVPDLVAARDRKGLSAMDIVAVLAKVVQQQQQELSDQRQQLDSLKAQLAMGRGKH